MRLVDTAGFEGSKQLDETALVKRSLNRNMVHEMLRQTRNALIYADLALFLVDAREGITFNDVALYKWLTMAEQADRYGLAKKKGSKDSNEPKIEQEKRFD